MIGITEAQKERLLGKLVGEFYGAPISDKDQGALADMLHTEPLLKVLGRIRADTDQLAAGIINMDLGDEKERHRASVLQGVVRGRLNTIEVIMDLATLPEEQSDGTDTTADATAD